MNIYHNLSSTQAENAFPGEEFPDDMPYLLDEADVIDERERYRDVDARMTINAVMLKFRTGKADAETAFNALVINDALDTELVMTLLSDFYATLDRVEA